MVLWPVSHRRRIRMPVGHECPEIARRVYTYVLRAESPSALAKKVLPVGLLRLLGYAGQTTRTSRDYCSSQNSEMGDMRRHGILVLLELPILQFAPGPGAAWVVPSGWYPGTWARGTATRSSKFKFRTKLLQVENLRGGARVSPLSTGPTRPS
eukprot:3234996-Rhodomonas_salina.2